MTILTNGVFWQVKNFAMNTHNLNIPCLQVELTLLMGGLDDHSHSDNKECYGKLKNINVGDEYFLT